MIIGLDDTDSRTMGMCTTYLACLIAEKIKGTVKERTLVRLNPNIPYKTRGNACLSIHIDTDSAAVRDTVIELVEEYAVFQDGDTNPAVAFHHGDPSSKISEFTREAVRDVKSVREAKETAKKTGIELESWGNERGVVGAVAAVGSSQYLDQLDDWSYELITYRDNGWSDERQVDYDSYFRADDKLYPDVWDTVDRSLGSVVAVPNTEGPIIHGLRGTYQEVWKANAVTETQDADHVAVYRTNQGTDAHLIENPRELREWRSYHVKGTVSEPPETREGGHVFFEIKPENQELDERVRCAGFEPTKRFRETLRKLRQGDDVEVCGGYGDGTIKTEKIRVTDLEETELRNPICGGCDTSMESAGRNQGYRCRDCGTSRKSKQEIKIDRELEKGWYEVPPSARRHIAMPLIRRSR